MKEIGPRASIRGAALYLGSVHAHVAKKTLALNCTGKSFSQLPILLCSVSGVGLGCGSITWRFTREVMMLRALPHDAMGQHYPPPPRAIGQLRLNSLHSRKLPMWEVTTQTHCTF